MPLQRSYQLFATDSDMHLFRIKGILSVRHADVQDEDEQYVDDNGLDARRYIVQAVHDLWEIHPASDDLGWDRSLTSDGTLPERTCKLVFIGRYLREDDLREGFRECFVHTN